MPPESNRPRKNRHAPPCVSPPATSRPPAARSGTVNDPCTRPILRRLGREPASRPQPTYGASSPATGEKRPGPPLSRENEDRYKKKRLDNPTGRHLLSREERRRVRGASPCRAHSCASRRSCTLGRRTFQSKSARVELTVGCCALPPDMRDAVSETERWWAGLCGVGLTAWLCLRVFPPPSVPGTL